MKKITTYFAMFCVAAIFSSCNSESTQKKEQKSVESVDSDTITTVEKIELSEKKQLLTDLIGEHSLVSISGAMGANTMVDYYKEKGVWTASGSSIYQAMREPFDIDLTGEDLQKLKTMKIVVSPDLTVSLVCAGKTYFKAPFKEDGFTNLLKKSPADYSLPSQLKSSSTFIGDNLYIYAKDMISEAEISAIDIAQVAADVAVLTYDKKTKEFTLSQFYGECCDNSTYIFK